MLNILRLLSLHLRFSLFLYSYKIQVYFFLFSPENLKQPNKIDESSF